MSVRKFASRSVDTGLQFAARLGRYQFALLSLLLAFLAYGLLIPWLGMYWDDWPVSWIYHQFGAELYQGYPAYRPISGWIYYFSFSALGMNLVAWHIYTLLARWLSMLAFYWVLRLVWPGEKQSARVAALLFLLYPGFSQMSIAVTYSVYFVYYALFLCSLALMVLAVKGRRPVWGYVLASIVLAVATMLSTEYFYGLELLRPLIIVWLLQPKRWGAWRRALGLWLPYAAMFAGVFLWRNWASQQEGALYHPVLFGRLAVSFWPTLQTLFHSVVRDVTLGGLGAWLRVLEAFNELRIGAISTYMYLALLVLAIGACAFVLRATAGTRATAGGAKGMVLGGLLTLLVSGASFWVAALPFALTFPYDRFTISMMVGASLLLAGLWTLWPVASRFKFASLAILLGLCVAFHFNMANQYRAEWLRMQDFSRQLTWRIPSLAPNTGVISPQLRALNFNTDNSLTGLVNWLYTPNDVPQYQQQLNHLFFYAELRGRTRLRGLQTGEPIYGAYDLVPYQATREQVIELTFGYQPPACLRVIDPEIDAWNPGLSLELKPIAALSNQALILPETIDFAARFPFWSVAPQETWCFYFEQADLARQLHDWPQVAALGQAAFAAGLAPNFAAEYTPFIEAYAHLGDGEQALQLTQRVQQADPLLRPLLCALWQRIERAGAMPTVVAEARQALECR